MAQRQPESGDVLQRSAEAGTDADRTGQRLVSPVADAPAVRRALVLLELQQPRQVGVGGWRYGN